VSKRKAFIINLRHHSTTTTEIESTQEQSKENNENQSEQVEHVNQGLNAKVVSAPPKALKRRICLDSQSSSITDARFKSTNLNNSAKEFFRHIQLPTVASTQYLDTASLKTDIFYKGFRPLLSPVERPIVKNYNKKPTIPLSWNTSACKLTNFDDFSKVPQFVVDKLTPFNKPASPGNEIRLGNKSRKELKQQEKLSKEVLEFIKFFKK
jgi:hypothetical protein